jgi:hypothetical protein
MKNKTQRRIHKYLFSHYFCFVFSRRNFIRGNAATNNTPNEGGKNHRGKVKEVETFQYRPGNMKITSDLTNLTTAILILRVQMFFEWTLCNLAQNVKMTLSCSD